MSTSSEPCLLYAAQFSKNNGGQFIAAGGSGSNECKIFHRETGKVCLFVCLFFFFLLLMLLMLWEKKKQIVGEVYGFKKGIYTLDFRLTISLFALVELEW